MAPKHRSEELSQIEEKQLSSRKSAVLILLFPENGQLKTVVIKRSEYDGVHSGQIAFPGGKNEKDDIDFAATALRETREEIGVEADLIEIIGQLTDLYILPSNFQVKAFVGYCARKPDYVLDKKEVQSVIELNIDDLYNEQNILEKEFSSASRGMKIKAPYFSVNGIEIWGATAMIISELLEVLKPKA